MELLSKEIISNEIANKLSERDRISFKFSYPNNNIKLGPKINDLEEAVEKDSIVSIRNILRLSTNKNEIIDNIITYCILHNNINMLQEYLYQNRIITNETCITYLYSSLMYSNSKIFYYVMTWLSVLSECKDISNINKIYNETLYRILDNKILHKSDKLHKIRTLIEHIDINDVHILMTTFISSDLNLFTDTIKKYTSPIDSTISIFFVYLGNETITNEHIDLILYYINITNMESHDIQNMMTCITVNDKIRNKNKLSLLNSLDTHIQEDDIYTVIYSIINKDEIDNEYNAEEQDDNIIYKNKRLCTLMRYIKIKERNDKIKFNLYKLLNYLLKELPNISINNMLIIMLDAILPCISNNYRIYKYISELFYDIIERENSKVLGTMIEYIKHRDIKLLTDKNKINKALQNQEQINLLIKYKIDF
ncbi:Hypothetical protein ORPV_89 [Orpheovirus IHUMI-LCC2]|uniref:Uncharacterized protein n=1 Tax=Orpheovirus IHUMI-LCC2 TaxID=2023057 RepID=A0A2I2L390_9VIRU|nr:Hypothetical protein ORPV_89 [Orpheovirus IHUMI-LCC2]SNW61993.1 Hypothetical protein ORPV_89 [Orpheovirus IHUMI-LCC2]